MIKRAPDKIRAIFFGIVAVKQPGKAIENSALQAVYFTTKDNTKLESWYFPTAGSAKEPVILCNAPGSTKSAITSEAAAFRTMGYHTLLVDFWAHGGSGDNTCTIGDYEAEDVKLACDYIKDQGEKNVVLWGISMSAAAVSTAMNDYPLRPSKIILEMPFASIIEAAERRIRMMGLPPPPLAIFITFRDGTEHGFWPFSMKPCDFAKKLTVPVLLPWGKNDPRVSQCETERIYRNLAGKKQLVLYENSGHESLCKKENAKWLSAVQNFLAN